MPQSKTTSTSTLRLVNSTIDIPAIPKVLIRLDEIIADPTASAEDVARVVCEDPAVSSNILRIVNSAYYGLQVRVSSLSLAISIIGFKMTKKVALQAAVYSAFCERREQCGDFDALSFWEESVYAGVAARTLASSSAVFAEMHPEDVFMAGLLHDIGKIILIGSTGAQHLGKLQKPDRASLFEAGCGDDHFGSVHAEIRFAMAARWSLPAALIDTFKNHQSPSGDSLVPPLSALICLASHLASRAQGTAAVGVALPPLHHIIYDRVGLSHEQVEELLPAIADDFAASVLPW